MSHRHRKKESGETREAAGRIPYPLNSGPTHPCRRTRILRPSRGQRARVQRTHQHPRHRLDLVHPSRALAAPVMGWTAGDELDLEMESGPTSCEGAESQLSYGESPGTRGAHRVRHRGGAPCTRLSASAQVTLAFPRYIGCDLTARKSFVAADPARPPAKSIDAIADLLTFEIPTLVGRPASKSDSQASNFACCDGPSSRSGVPCITALQPLLTGGLAKARYGKLLRRLRQLIALVSAYSDV